MIDETLKYKIRAVFESHKLSPKRVMEERFSKEDVSVKTVESWISKEGWEKNKYHSYAMAIECLLDETIEEKLLEKGKELLHADVVDGLPDRLGAEITKEAVRKAITSNSLIHMMGENILRMEEHAKNSSSMGTSATFQAALISTMGAIHGKEVRHTFKSLTEISDEDLEKYSEEELKQLILQAEGE